MSHLPRVLQGLARLLSYPDQHTAQVSELLYVVLQSEIPDAASQIGQFGTFVEQHDAWQVEEAFTSTFDVNPACALEVGWHLFGEEYARGMFLVRMREELRKYGIDESHELPDHISHVLAVVAAMPEREAAEFVRACVQPAVERMRDAITKLETPYQHVIACLATVIGRVWGTSQHTEQARVLESHPLPADPLHAFPVADIGCGGCSDSPGESSLVTLDTTSLQPHRQTSHPSTNSEESS